MKTPEIAMPTSPRSDEMTIGFLSVKADDHSGYVGGHLVLNSRGRPVEFRCTSPVQPSRAQQVLYGATLGPHIRGDLIAKALFQNTRSKPELIFTDDPHNMEARQLLDVPLLLVHLPTRDEPQRTSEPTSDAMRSLRDDNGHGGLRAPQWIKFQLGQRPVMALADYAQDRDRSEQLWVRANEWIDLIEPFERITEAIDEAQSS